jgi:hypothetical protein
MEATKPARESGLRQTMPARVRTIGKDFQAHASAVCLC